MCATCYKRWNRNGVTEHLSNKKYFEGDKINGATRLKDVYKIKCDKCGHIRQHFTTNCPNCHKNEKYLSILTNSMLNDNGIYSVGQRKSVDDYIDNQDRNITLAGLESSVAKGYNYFEETQGKGFEVVYFDNEPVSPPTIKKYPNEHDELQDYKSNYNISTFAQAIGRGFRKNKDVMTLCFNKIDDNTFQDVVEYLEEHTDSRVLVEELTLTNLKISISSMIKNENYEIIKDRLKNNELFNNIYGDESL
jgi:hypothetical protein